MSYYRFNRQEILRKAKDGYSKEKGGEYYLKNKEAIKKNKIKKNQKIYIQNCQKIKKIRLKSIKEKDISN